MYRYAIKIFAEVANASRNSAVLKFFSLSVKRVTCFIF